MNKYHYGIVVILTPVLLALGVFTQAMATPMTGQWQQKFKNGTGVTWTEAQFFMETPQVGFSGPATGASFPSGWRSSLVNPNYVDLTGPSHTGAFSFILHFNAPKSTPFKMDFLTYNNDTLLTAANPAQTGSLAWNGSAFRFEELIKNPSQENRAANGGTATAVPEPSEVGLFGLGLLLILTGRLGLRRRHDYGRAFSS